jgi:hypothetical protein
VTLPIKIILWLVAASLLLSIIGDLGQYLTVAKFMGVL